MTTDFQYDDLNKFDYTKEDLEFKVSVITCPNGHCIYNNYRSSNLSRVNCCWDFRSVLLKTNI